MPRVILYKYGCIRGHRTVSLIDDNISVHNIGQTVICLLLFLILFVHFICHLLHPLLCDKISTLFSFPGFFSHSCPFHFHFYWFHTMTFFTLCVLVICVIYTFEIGPKMIADWLITYSYLSNWLTGGLHTC